MDAFKYYSSLQKYCIGNIDSCGWFWITEFSIHYMHGKPYFVYVSGFFFLSYAPIKSMIY